MEVTLDQLVPKFTQTPALLARFFAILAHLEYVGARKIAKALPADHANAEHLEHLMEEARHGFLLRSHAELLAKQSNLTLDYSAVAGAEPYLQAVDRGIATRLAQEGRLKHFVNYLIVSLIIEERAMEFYPALTRLLPEGPARGVIQTILRDEVGHLEQMRQLCSQHVPNAQELLGDCRQLEHRAYDEKFRPVLERLAESAA